MDREVHAPDSPRGLVVLLPVDRNLARFPSMALDEVGRLNEQSTGPAGGVEHATLVGLEHLDQQPGHRARRVELAAAMALGGGEALDEVLVRAADDVASLVLVVAEADLGDRRNQLT